MPSMSALIQPALTGLSLAADVSGVPGLGLADGLLTAIQTNCDNVVAHKVVYPPSFVHFLC